MGKWGDGESPSLPSLRSWAKSYWHVKGELHLTFLSGPLILFEFEVCSEAKMIFRKGRGWYKGENFDTPNGLLR